MSELESLKKRVDELEEFKEIVSVFFSSIFSRVNNESFYYSQDIYETILWALEHAFKEMYNHGNCKIFEEDEKCQHQYQ